MGLSKIHEDRERSFPASFSSFLMRFTFPFALAKVFKFIRWRKIMHRLISVCTCVTSKFFSSLGKLERSKGLSDARVEHRGSLEFQYLRCSWSRKNEDEGDSLELLNSLTKNS